MASQFQLTKNQIIAALAAMNDKLAQREVTGEICVFGGAAMILAFDARQSTRDIDGVFVPKAVISEAVTEVAADLKLPLDWLNDGVKDWLSSEADLVADGMPQFSHLRILRPSASYLLAMKCLAARAAGYDTSGDQADAMTLIKHLNLGCVEDVLKIVCRYYPESNISPKTRYFVDEIMQELGGVA